MQHPPLSSEESARACVWACVCAQTAFSHQWEHILMKNNASLLPTPAAFLHEAAGVFLNTPPRITNIVRGGGGRIMASQEPSPPSSLEGNKPGFPKKILANNLENKHLCKSCQKVLRRPLQAQCGHRFCCFCFHKIVRWVPLLLAAS